MAEENKKYRPSNGSEGCGFMGAFCENCKFDNGELGIYCDILGRTMIYEVTDPGYPDEWTYDEKGAPTCTKFSKWRWIKDDDGNWIKPEEIPPVDPNQLALF